MATAAVEGAVRSNGVIQGGALSAHPVVPPTTSVQKKKPTAVDGKKHDRQHSLRHANSVELTHRRLNSNGSNHTHAGEQSGLIGREGRQCTVANVGNNGMIFLRPVIRPAAQARSKAPPVPAYTFPAAPADNATEINDHLQISDDRRASSEAAPESVFSGIQRVVPQSPITPTRATRPSLDQRSSYGYVESPPVPRLHRHHRAHSFSTLSEKHQSRTVDTAGGRLGLQSADDHRPRTAESAVPALEVNIPNHRLGSPRFSSRGTAIFRSSTYTGNSTTDGLGSSAFSDGDYDQIFPLPPGMPRSSPASPGLQSTFRRRTVSNHRRPRGPIESRMFDDLTFHPRADDTSVVRYSPANGSITAATPARLIAQITSPNFLDYDLLSDFFLTFRSYLSTFDLTSYLMARLQWAIRRNDDVGKIVKVRTFVAMRHWILNYFVDDFVPDLALRVMFCNTVNDLCRALRTRPDAGLHHIKLMGELKKCWRRTCDLYWDGPPVSDESNTYEELLPGGLAGTRANPTFLTGNPPASPPADQTTSGAAADMMSHFVGSSAAHQESPARPTAAISPNTAAMQSSTSNIAQRVMSASSDTSVQVLSCSIPAKGFRRIEAVLGGNLHPTGNGPPTAQGPFPNRPRQPRSHQRSGSFSDALRDDRSPLPQPKPTATGQPAPVQKRLVYPGSLIRGNLIPPSRVLVQAIVPDGSANTSRSKLILISNGVEVDEEMEHKPNTMSGPAMRKLLGSVRRALSNKNASAVEPGCGPESLLNAYYPYEKKMQLTRRGPTRPDHEGSSTRGGLVRIDLLHEKIFEAFKDIRKEEAKTAVLAAGQAEAKRTPPKSNQRKSALARTPPPEIDPDHRRKVASTVTMGSKSIIIIDDTRPPMVHVMSGALQPPMPAETASTPQDGTDPSRPKPAEGHSHRTDEVGSTTVETKADRSFPAGPATSQVDQSSSDGKPRASTERMSTELSPAQSKGKSGRSMRTLSRPRYASFQSGVTRQETVRSFDATTLTGSERGSWDDYFSRPPITRVLRRRPGGDLRAAQHMKDLEPMIRPRSAGSITTRCSSIRTRASGNVAVGIADSECSGEQRRRFSLGALAEVHDEKGVSLMHTHSSQPNLRPSFEAEVAKLAHIPDGDEDGGIESTLLKLEGRFDRRDSDESPLDYGIPKEVRSVRPSRRESEAVVEDPQQTELEPSAPRLHHTSCVAPAADGQSQRKLSATTDGDETLVQPTTPGLPSAREEMPPLSPSAKSEESYSSIPLLERGWSERSTGESGLSQPCSSLSTPRASLKPQPIKTERKAVAAINKVEPRIDEVQETFLLDDDDPTRSFLLDDDEDLSDLSSEMSLDLVSDDLPDEPEPNTFPPMGDGAMISGVGGGLSNHPLRHPPTPPLLSEHRAAVPVANKTADRFQEMPLTPESSPVDQKMMQGFEQHLLPRPGMQQQQQQQQQYRHQQQQATTQAHVLQPRSVSPEKASSHLPFILAHDPEVLAQQFTLCEKDALSEVDWRDLVDLRWRQTLPAVQNWVDYLKTQEPKGVELVIARFNVMVKWALSEIVLTKDLRERARAISHYIQIAAHARRYRNYATMYQIAVAVLSTDCSRLTDTWELVPDADIRTLKELEALIQPVRNFHNLRVEMETATAEEGCIPFIGIYTHDLVFNSHRPSRIEVSGDGEPLVNFERHRVTAAIVKNLLRLVEGSTKYKIQPVEGVIERCLWMAALPDDEIHALSKSIQ